MVLGKFHYAFLIAACCCLIQAFGMGLVLACGSLFYVPVCDDLGFSRGQMSTYMTGYFIGTTIATPVAGKLLSKFDMRIVVSIAVFFLACAVGLMSTYQHLWQFQISGLMVGLAGSCVFVLPAATLVGNWFVHRRGMVYGIVMASSGISTAIFSPLINSLIESSGWRFGYIAMASAMFLVIFPCSLLLRTKPSDVGTTPWGYRAEIDGGGKNPHMRGVSTKRALCSISFLCLILFAGIASFCHGGIEQHIPGYIVSIGFTASFGALVVSAESIGSVFDKLLMGWLNDKIGVQKTTLIEIVVIMLGLLGFIFIKEPAALIAAAFLFGIQDSLMSVSVPLLIREIFGSKNYTQIHAWIRTGVGIFGAFSGVVVGGIYDLTGQFAGGFILLLVLYVVGFFLIIFAYKARKNLGWEAEGLASRDEG